MCDVSQSVVLAVIHYIAINVTETVSLFIGRDIHAAWMARTEQGAWR